LVAPSTDHRLVTEDGLQIIANCMTTGTGETGCVGVRPEKVVVSRDATSLPNNFVGTIERLSYCGNLSHATIRIPRGRMVEATIVNSDHTGASTLKPGDAVHVAFPIEAAVVLSS
jgi:ABC-type sugar transport system ATPase subunit